MNVAEHTPAPAHHRFATTAGRSWWPAWLLGTLPWLANHASAQLPGVPFEFHAVVAPAAQRGAVPAIAWFAEHWLPAHGTMAQGVSLERTFALHGSPSGLVVATTRTEPGKDLVAAGSCRLGDGAPLLWQCRTDGTEDWFVPADFVLPAAWLSRLRTLDADVLGQPRTLATAVLAGHLAGGLAEGDPRAELLRLCASECGDLTWLAWHDGAQLRVRGRSEGGLLLPALLLLFADDGRSRDDGLALRAFAARDHERDEAARQLGLSPSKHSVTTLRAMLHGDDTTRLCAIDALTRRGAAEELPAIVAAADETAPLATLAATDALRSLWVDASPLARQRTRAAIAQSTSLDLRRIDLDALPRRAAAPAAPAPTSTADRTTIALVWLSLTAFGLLGLWLRERHRERGSPSTAVPF